MNARGNALRGAALWLRVALTAPSAVGAQQQNIPAGTGEVWQIVQPPQSSLVYARDGALIGEIGHQWRTSVPLRAMSRYVRQAFIAAEDKRFYTHDGVDMIGVLGAVKDNILGERRGASTITQQLVGNMHPDLIDRRDRSLGRKLREQSAARELEKHYTKEQVLEAYLNQIDLGHHWFGVEAAARHYFGKTAARLTLAEAATLAALPKSPSLYDPTRFPGRAKTRRNLILGLMAEQGYIPDAAAAEAKRQPMITLPNGGMAAPSGYFVDVVRQLAERAGIPVMNGGFRIYTTMDGELQRDAVAALVDGIAKVEAKTDYHHPKVSAGAAGGDDNLQGMVVAIDPLTGDVEALVGGRNYTAAPFNRATNALRQPGSSIKPIVYAAAIADSIAPSAVIPDTALAIPLPNGDVYRPQDADGLFLGAMTIREGLIQSRNAVAVQIGMKVGMDSVAALAARLGITAPIAPVPSSAIGASAVRPIELVSAYTAFANTGSLVAPRFLMRIDDLAGRTVFSVPPSSPQRVLDPRVAFIVRNMMEDAVSRGTGSTARRGIPSSVPVAGKTGTTNDNVDVWFVGMTPRLVAGVWVGFDRPRTIMRGAAGGSLAAPIWGQMMARHYANRSVENWSVAPPGMLAAELDRDSGQLAGPSTPAGRRYVEYFVEGTEPPALHDNPWKLPQFGPLIFY